jgi:hypothetical protein
MFPRQFEEIARQRTQEMRSHVHLAARPASSSAPGRRNFATIRSYTGWSIVQIGLRIAIPGGR